MASTPPATLSPTRPQATTPSDSHLQERHKKQLISLSRRVLQKVQESGVTTGNQIAKEILSQEPVETQEGEFKNIQRRVYDALNVLHALNVISKERNEIRYKGLISREDVFVLQKRLESKRSKVRDRRKMLIEHFLQYVSLKRLLERNQKLETKSKVALPCLVALSSGKSSVQVGNDSLAISGERPFTLLNDTQILAKIGLHRVTQEDLNEDLPADLVRFVSEKEREERTAEANVDFVKLFHQISTPKSDSKLV